MPGAAPAGVALGGTFHAPDVHQGSTIDGDDGLAGGPRLLPVLAFDLIVQRRQTRQQAEDAVGRTQVATPDAFAAPVEITDDECQHRGTTKDQQGRFGIFIDADQLAIDGDADEGHHRPARPLQPARHRTPLTMPAGPFGERAFRA